MIHIKKVLVPVDFSEASKKAVNYGLSLALEFNARLILAHIAPFDAVACEAAKGHLLQLIPAEYRDRSDFEIIVKSLQGKGRLERALLGTTAERVIRTATIPVLSLPLPATYADRWAAA